MQKFFPPPSELDSAEHLGIEDHVTTLLSRAPSHLFLVSLPMRFIMPLGRQGHGRPLAQIMC